MTHRVLPVFALLASFAAGWWCARSTHDAAAKSTTSSTADPATWRPHHVDPRNRECFPEYVRFDGSVDEDDSCILQSDWTIDERLFCAKYKDDGEIVPVPGAPRRCLAWAIDEDARHTREMWAAEARCMEKTAK